MKPARFEFDAPASQAEAVAILAEYGDEAKVLAGGQSLVPLLNFRLARPGRLVDINGLSELSFAERHNDSLALGAMTRQREIETSEAVSAAAPLLAMATAWIGHPAIRTRGTIGGCLAHNDPAGEYPAALLALDAMVQVVSARGARTIGVDELLGEWLTTTLAPDELLVRVTVPATTGRAGYGITELARRHGDFALAGSVVRLAFASTGAIADARVVGFGGLPRATRLTAAEDVLRGARPGEEVFAEAAAAGSASVDPTSDMHATADYRRHLLKILTVRALRQAGRREDA